MRHAVGIVDSADKRIIHDSFQVNFYAIHRFPLGEPRIGKFADVEQCLVPP
jgi:hypothetical protein